ncbi:putative 4-coumarate--CoA ligase 3 [Oratosquilla oratoria]|uniref:putative 4-coumarate--CoA ligase 3 n=1 Tax=Oratosquilla oratoria TaxID=337810 RepID=UPI003F7580C0
MILPQYQEKFRVLRMMMQSSLRHLTPMRGGWSGGPVQRHMFLLARASSSTQQPSSHVIRSSFPDVSLPSGNVVQHVLKNAFAYSDKVALECSITGASYTYGQLVDAVARLGGFLLHRLNVSKGDTVALVSPNCPEFAIVLLGALQVGITVSTINATHTAQEIAGQLEESQSKVVFGSPAIESRLQEALRLHRNPAHLVLTEPGTSTNSTNVRKVIEDYSIPFADPAQLTGEEIAVLPYSSGTSGKPKGVALSHNAFVSNIAMLRSPYIDSLRDTTSAYQEKLIGLLPFSHAYGLICLVFLGLQKGSKIVTMPKMEPNNFLSTIKRHKIRVLHLAPPLLHFLNTSSVTSSDLEHVEVVMCGGAPVLPTNVEIFKNKARHPVFLQNLYGMTEILVSLLTPLAGEKAGFGGKLIANTQAKVVDLETGENLPINHTGEICFKTPSMMIGYYNRPDATSEAIDSDGWLHTGDVGFYDQEGYFKIVDRTKDVFKVKGLQVSPSEVEDVLLQHEDVLDVGVVGIPHDRFGEAPRAYIVRKRPVSESDIHNFLSNRVAPHKQLTSGIVFVDNLPKSPTGKLLRRVLKKWI